MDSPCRDAMEGIQRLSIFFNLAIVLFLPVTAVPRVYASTPFCFFVRNMLHITYIRIVVSVLISSYPGTF